MLCYAEQLQHLKSCKQLQASFSVQQADTVSQCLSQKTATKPMSGSQLLQLSARVCVLIIWL